MAYSNAGQTPPLIIKGEGHQSVWLKPTSAAIGLIEAYDPQRASVKLSQGDIVFFYTDGVTEASNPQDEQFGMKQLEILLAANADLSAQEIVALVREEIKEFSAGQALADDTTMIAMKVVQKK